jgi:hypothetical protein
MTGGTVLAAIIRRIRITGWKLRGRKVYLCHLAHPNDRLAAGHFTAYFDWMGVPFEVIEFNSSGQRPELRPALGESTIAVIGYNSQLDHSWIGEEKFVAMAEQRQIPVIQCILDHPSNRWPEFSLNLNARNVRYLFVAGYCEQYFQRYCVPGAHTVTASFTASPLARADDVSREDFLARDIPCLIALNLRRQSGTGEEMEARIGTLEPRVADTVREAIDPARHDLDNPLTMHLERALSLRGIELPNQIMHVCAAIVEDMTHLWRRRRIFEVASAFPVLIQTDLPPPELVARGVAAFRTGAEWTDPGATVERMKSCRSVLSVSLTNDALHDRTGNGVNAGCVPIVEDNTAHRRLFEDRKNALFFRYDDDSLERCLALVCHDPERAWDIARRSTPLRDDPVFRFPGSHRLLDLVPAPVTSRNAPVLN